MFFVMDFLEKSHNNLTENTVSKSIPPKTPKPHFFNCFGLPQSLPCQNRARIDDKSNLIVATNNENEQIVEKERQKHAQPSQEGALKPSMRDISPRPLRL